MAKSEATLVLKLKDEATSALAKLKSALGVVTIATGGLLAVMKDAFASYMESEAASSKLSQALRDQGVYSVYAARRLEDLATNLQRVSTFSDETIMSAE